MKTVFGRFFIGDPVVPARKRSGIARIGVVILADTPFLRVCRPEYPRDFENCKNISVMDDFAEHVAPSDIRTQPKPQVVKSGRPRFAEKREANRP